jgi:hypothetical protein
VRLSDRLRAVDHRVRPQFRRGFWLKPLDALVDAGAMTKKTAMDCT